jgi:hypothetical protein
MDGIGGDNRGVGGMGDPETMVNTLANAMLNSGIAMGQTLKRQHQASPTSPSQPSQFSADQGSANYGSAAGVDRVNTPGKLRAFFDEVKRSRSAGDNVSVPQKYRDMLAEDRAARNPTPAIQQSRSLPPGASFGVSGVSGGVGNGGGGRLSVSHARGNSMPGIKNGQGVAAAMVGGVVRSKQRQSMYEDKIEEFGGENEDGPTTLDMSALSKTYPGRRKPSVNPRMIIPKIEDKKLDEDLPMDSPEAAETSSDGPETSSSDDTEKKIPITKPAASVAKKSQPSALKPSAAPKPSSKKTTPTVDEPPEKSGDETTTESGEAEAESEEDKKKKRSPTPDGMTRCEFCERCFNSDRLEKHMNVCQMNPDKKKRKTFDGKSIRTKGTEFESFKPTAGNSSGVGASSGNAKGKRAPPKKVDWRKQHEDFINAIRAAKGA